jgi:hypothetical protein
MIILSKKQYDELLQKASDNKVDPKVVELETEIQNLKTAALDAERAKRLLIEDHEIALKRKENETDIKISEATAALTKENSDLKIESANFQKEAEILTKAFENMGFDVKDMKDILNKLVDGVVSKNTIQLVK